MTIAFSGKSILASVALTIIVIILILGFCSNQFSRYSEPTADNTSVINVTVSDIYYSLSAKTIAIETSSGDEFQLVYPTSSREMYEEIGYDFEDLEVLLKGKNVELLVMNDLPWVVEIHVDGETIDNSILTEKQAGVTRASIIILGLIMLAFPICGEITYISRRG